MSVTEGLLSFTLTTIHYSRMLKIYLTHTLTWLSAIVLFIIKHKGIKLADIQDDAQTLVKIPQHIAFLTNIREEHLNLNDLAKLVVWALASGIRTVSLYHPNDALNNKFQTLRQHIVRHHEVMFSPPVPQVEVTSSRISIAEKPDDKTHNSCTGYNVLVLSPEDGQQRLTELARELSTCVSNRQCRVEEIDFQYISDKLVLRDDAPDPDLALLWGDTSSTLGYPPWQLRLTEIQSLQHNGKVTYQDFFRALQRYAGCQQRFGK